MMISNTAQSNDPVMNPFNQRSLEVARQIGKINYGKFGNPKTLEVPCQDVPMFGSEEWSKRYDSQSKLVPPNQDIPMADQVQGNGFIPGHDNLFRLGDGTIVDFKSRKVVFDPNDHKSNNGQMYWGDPDRSIQYGSQEIQLQAYAPAEKKFEEMIAIAQSSDSKLVGLQSMNQLGFDQIDPKSAQYWLRAEQEADKLRSQMTPEQVKMIDDFENHFPPSRLIEEAAKQKDQRQYNIITERQMT